MAAWRGQTLFTFILSLSVSTRGIIYLDCRRGTRPWSTTILCFPCHNYSSLGLLKPEPCVFTLETDFNLLPVHNLIVETYLSPYLTASATIILLPLSTHTFTFITLLFVHHPELPCMTLTSQSHAKLSIN